MFSDDVYRANLASVIAVLEAWARTQRDVAEIDTAAVASYWKMAVAPHAGGACPFEILLRADQRFDVLIAGETYEDKPIDRFDFFPMLARAICKGDVARVEISNALTSAPEAIETHVTLEDGWAWIGERRIGARAARRIDTTVESRTRRFLPYRR